VGPGTRNWDPSGTQMGRYWDPVFGFRQLFMNVSMYLWVKIKFKLNKVLHFPIINELLCNSLKLDNGEQGIKWHAEKVFIHFVCF
jgi:hypothetical protein